MNKRDNFLCKRLSDQLKFFGAKPKRFVSIYARKPRIRVGSKPKEKLVGLVTTIDYNKSRHEYLEGLASCGGLGLNFGAAMAVIQSRSSQHAARAQAMAAQSSLDYQRMQYDQLRNVGGLSNQLGGMSQARAVNSKAYGVMIWQ